MSFLDDNIEDILLSEYDEYNSDPHGWDLDLFDRCARAFNKIQARLADCIAPEHWQKADGRLILIRKMDDFHLENAIRFIRRRGGWYFLEKLDGMEKEKARRIKKGIWSERQAPELDFKPVSDNR